MAKLLDIDPVSGLVETFDQDKMTGKITVRKFQEVDTLFAENAVLRNSARSGWQGDFHKVASIPLITVEMWWEELKAKGLPNPDPFCKDNKQWLVAKLNSRDWQKLRTKEGRI
jgi:hypothetical protein